MTKAELNRDVKRMYSTYLKEGFYKVKNIYDNSREEFIIRFEKIIPIHNSFAF